MEKRKASYEEVPIGDDSFKNVTTVKGSALETDKSKKTVIAHVVNDQGAWGAGFVLAISSKWKEPEEKYKMLCAKIDRTVLPGTVQFVNVEENITVCNMFAMKGLASKTNPVPLCMNSLLTCLKTLRMKTERDNVEIIQMPKIGAGLARGHWPSIYKLVRLVFKDSPVQVTVKQL